MAPQTAMGVTGSKTSPRHLNFLKQLKKTTEMMRLLRVLFLDTPGHPTSDPQYMNSSKYTKYRNYQTISRYFFFYLSSCAVKNKCAMYATRSLITCLTFLIAQVRALSCERSVEFCHRVGAVITYAVSVASLTRE